MKRISAILLVLCAAAFCIPQYTEAQTPEIFRQEGIASWYGPEFDGRPTASGEIFNSSFLTAAHPTLPFGTMLVVTNRHNNKQVSVRVNDRGPFVSARIIDVSKAAAEQLDMLVTGTAPVLVESIDRIALPASGRAATSDPYWTLPPTTAAAPAAPQPPAPQPAAPAPVAQPAPAVVYAPAPPVTPAPAAPYPQAAPVYAPPAPDQYPQAAPVYTPAAPVTAAPAAPYPQAAPVYAPPAPEQYPQAAPVYTPAAPVTAAPATPYPQAAPVVTSQPVQTVQPPSAAVLTPAINPAPNKIYRMQVGSYKVARNAVDAYEKLKNAGLNPAYERNGEFFRVVLAGIQGNQVQSITERLGAAGFKEALIREEH